MLKLTDYSLYRDAQAHANSKALWALFDGDRQRFNISQECNLRHAVGRSGRRPAAANKTDGCGRIAVRIAHAGGADESLSFDTIADRSARFAHWLERNGIQSGDRVAFMLEPS